MQGDAELYPESLFCGGEQFYSNRHTRSYTLSTGNTKLII